jgi:hypothetical protein
MKKRNGKKKTLKRKNGKKRNGKDVPAQYSFALFISIKPFKHFQHDF